MFNPDADERREVADRLRAAHVASRPAKTREEYNEQNAEFVLRLAEALADVDRERLHYAPYEYDRRSLMDVLADLIDRPTCRNFGWEDGTNGEAYEFACTNCGYVGDVGDPNYCPNCGAEVVE